MLYKYILGLIVATLICYFIFFKNIIITEKLENFNGDIVGHNKEDYNIISSLIDNDKILDTV
jgi:hypothetical protein